MTGPGFASELDDSRSPAGRLGQQAVTNRVRVRGLDARPAEAGPHWEARPGKSVPDERLAAPASLPAAICCVGAAVVVGVEEVDGRAVDQTEVFLVEEVGHRGLR